MTTKINVAGVWKTPTIKINVAGVWKDVSKSINVAGTWKSIYSSGPTVDVRADGRTNSRLDNACYVGLAFYTTGLEYEYSSTGSVTNSWTYLTSGSASQVWIMWTRTGGTLSDWDSLGGGYNNVRRNVTSNITYRLVDTISSTAGGAETITGYIRAYDAASGGNLLDTGPTATWSARRWHDACPLCCFTPDTPVRMASGLEVPIGQVREGDRIIVWNPDKLEHEIEEVGEVITRQNRPMYAIQFENGDVIKASADHPFHVKGKGPASISADPYKDWGVPAELSVGDVIQGYNSVHTITAIRQIEYPGTVFTFSNSLFYANGKLVY